MTIFCETEESTLAALLPALEAPVRTVESLPDAALVLSGGTNDDLVVVGPAIDIIDVIEFVEHLHDERPDVAVVLIRDELVDDEVQAATESGVRSVVRSDDVDAVAEACRTAWITVPTRELTLVPPPATGAGDVDESPTTPHKIVTVFAPKGGSGKTTMSTNLAVALHRRGAKVCLVDLDLEFGDVAIALQLAPDRTSVDAADVRAGDDELVAVVTTQYQPGLDCVLAPIEPGHADRVGAELVGRMLTQLRERYDYVVVDTPSEFTEQVLAAMDRSDVHVLLGNPEIPSIKNLRLTLDMLDLLGYPRSARAIVFNRADTEVGLTAEEVEKTLRAPIAMSVPASRDVPASINRGQPIVAANPDHPVSRAIDRIAREYVMGETAKSRRSLIGRVLRRRSA